MMKRETLLGWKRAAKKFDYDPSTQQVQTLIDSHLEALKEIDAAHSRGYSEGYDEGVADADNSHYL